MSSRQRTARLIIGVLAISFVICWLWSGIDPEGFARKAGDGASAFIVGTVFLALALGWFGMIAVGALLWFSGFELIERERLRELKDELEECRARMPT